MIYREYIPLRVKQRAPRQQHRGTHFFHFYFFRTRRDCRRRCLAKGTGRLVARLRRCQHPQLSSPEVSGKSQNHPNGSILDVRQVGGLRRQRWGANSAAPGFGFQKKQLEQLRGLSFSTV
jgi:hypothetical protein